MTITWQEAITPIDAATYRDQNLAALESAGSTINAWGPDAPQTAYLESESRAEAAESAIISTLARTASVQLVADAGDSWVGAAMTFFDIERIQALPCVWTVTLIIPAAQAPLTISASNASGIQAMAADGTIFQCTQQSPVTLDIAHLYQGIVQFTALVAGHAITPDSIDKIISGPAGLEVTEATQTLITQARAQESNESFIARGLGRWGVLFGNPNGTAGWTRTSFDFLIPHYAPSVTRWSVDDANPNGPGTVEVALANEDGPATSDEVDAVQAGLNSIDVKPVGSGALTVVAATPLNLTINVTLTVSGTNSDVATNCHDALIALGKAFPLGPATLEPSLVTTVAQGAPVASASIPIGAATKVIMPGLDGFASVEAVTHDLVAPAVLATGEVLVLTVNVSVA